MSEIKFTTDAKTGDQGPFKGVSKFSGLIFIVAILGILVFNSFKIVNEGYLGVKYRLGAIVENQDRLPAGLNIHIPFIETIAQIDIRNQIYEVQTDAYTFDTQNVNDLKMKLVYAYDPAKLTDIIQNIGIDHVSAKILAPNVARISKNAIGAVRAEDLVQTRAAVQTKIEEELREVLATHSILVTEFAIENIQFDEAFEQSIQEKVIAEQEAARTVNRTAQRREEARQVEIAADAEAYRVKIAAEAQATAIELINQQLARSPSYIEYLKVENWNGILPIAIGEGVNPFLVLGDTSNLPTSSPQAQVQAASPTTGS
ncbi:MAG: prohibitin family protein [Oscillospiraceae bacterium]|nr:prohibitin family protein [Oscillospiraceae bacterium]